MMQDHVDKGENGSTGDETATVTLTVPFASSCVPARALTVGGVARVHPIYSGGLVDASIADAPTPHWGAGVVTSVTTRSAVTFHRRTGSFQALSVKTGRIVSGLGPHEAAQCEDLEVDPTMTDYDLQSTLITWPAGSYLLDFTAHDVDRGIVAGEVKAHPSYFLDPEVAAKVANAERTLAGIGVSFKKVSGSNLHENVVRRRNVRRAYADRFTAVPPASRDAVTDALADRGELAMGTIRNILFNDARTADLMVHALLCRRVLAFDLDLPVTSDTIVRAPKSTTYHPNIRELEAEPA